MDKHVELAKSSGNKPKFPRNIDENILQNFTEITEGSDLNRIEATNILVKILLEKQKFLSKGELCTEVTYSLNRLIQGLASNRLNARLGFSVALCKLLQTFPELTTELVLKSVKERLAINKQDSKLEVGATLIGRVFTYLALIQCDRLDSTNVSEILKDVLEIRKKKSYLAEIGTQTSMLIAQKTDSVTFKTYVWPEIKRELRSGWEGCKPETLHLLMTCIKYQPTVVQEKFLKMHWNCSTIFSESNYNELLNVLVKCHREYPGIHMLIPAVVEELMKSPDVVDSFWSAVNSKLLTDTISKKTIALNLCFLLLQNTLSAKQVENFITPELCQVLIRALPDKKKDLHSICSEVMKKIISEVEKYKDGAFQYAVIKRLAEGFKTAFFDASTLIPPISGLIHSLPAEGAKLLIDDLFKTVQGNSVFLMKDSHNTDKIIVWALGNLRNLVTIPSCGTDHSWQINLLQFLFVKAFFIVKQTSDIPHCKDVSTLDFSDHVQKTCIDCFQKALNKLSSFHPVSVATKKKDLSQYINTVFEIVQYAKLLLKNKDFVELKNPFSEEVRTRWDKAIEVAETIHEKRKDSAKLDKDGAFELLFLYTSLQLLNTEPDASVELLQDMHVCYEKASSRQRKQTKKSEEEPEWIEVVTELLVSMLAQPSNLARVISHAVFTHLLSHITREAVAVILNVLQPQKEEENMDESDGEDSQEGEESLEATSSDDSQSDDDNHGDMDVDLSMRQTIKSALGKAAVSDNDGSDDVEDLSDSEMFKRDSLLAEAFRSMSKSKKEDKEKQRQLVVFKSKVIELLELIVKETPTSGIVLDIIAALLFLIETGIRKKEEKVIGDKACNIFYLLCKAKITPDITVKPDEILHTIKDLIKYSRKVTDTTMVKRVSDAILLLIRVLLNFEANKDPSSIKTRSKMEINPSKDDEGLQNQVVSLIESSLKNVLSGRLDHMVTEFFQNMFKKYPVMFSPISGSLLLALNDDSVKVYNKTQACILLSVLMNQQSPGLCTFSKDEFSKTLLHIVERELNKTRGEMKPKFLQNLLIVFSKYLITSKEDVEKIISTGLQEKLEVLKKSSNTDLRNAAKKVLNNYNRSRILGKKQTNENHKRKTSDAGFETQKKKIKTNSDNVEEQDSPEEDEENTIINSYAAKPKSKRCSQEGSEGAEDTLHDEVSLLSSATKKRKKRNLKALIK